MTRRKSVLIIAGSDPTGGAGIQQDVKTAQMLGVYGATAITALTVQTPRGVASLNLTAAQLLYDQIQAVCTTLTPDAVKIGMTGSVEIIEAIAEAIGKFGLKRVVLDPVAVSSAGGDLGISPSLLYRAMQRELFPLIDVVTPNRIEAQAFTGFDPARRDYLLQAAAEFCDITGVRSVVIKGGHFEGESIADAFFDSQSGVSSLVFSSRITSANTHGTGCTLSSAIAAHLALGCTPGAAFARAERFTRQAIANAAEYSYGLI